MGKVATSPLPPRGSPLPQSGGQNQKWPTSGQGGYITPAAWGVPTASERGAESEVAHKWARWLHNPFRLGVPSASERGAESEVAQRWAHCLQACIFSKIGNSSFVVRSCNFLIFVVNACRKKSSHCVIFFCGKSCNFFFPLQMRVTKKLSRREIFFCGKSCKLAYTTYSKKKNYTT